MGINCYIHIPFCSSKCKYCHFTSFVGVKNIQIEHYLKNLMQEIMLFEGKKTLDTIYFGGGTPSLLSINHFENVFLALYTKFRFTKNIEITLEANPCDITRENLKAWENLGINRISIGVQTLNEKSLRKIGRKDKGNIFNALDLIKKPKNISLDFIIGLPFVEKGEVKKDIETILDKYDFINHISVYMLEGYKSSLKEKEFLEEYLEVKDFLEKEGFKRYELSNFAKKGFECRHNKGYWQHKNYLGFGASAHGFVGKTRFSNYDKLIEYYKNIGIGRFQKSEKLSEKDLFLEKMMFDLRTTGIGKKDALKLNKEKIDEFVKNKYLKWGNNKLKLADKGILVLDYILGEIL